jgi:hypothetical protein
LSKSFLGIGGKSLKDKTKKESGTETKKNNSLKQESKAMLIINKMPGNHIFGRIKVICFVFVFPGMLIVFQSRRNVIRGGAKADLLP